MTDAGFGDAARGWLAHAIGGVAIADDGKRLRIERLRGSTTSSVYRVAHPAVADTFALRVLDNPLWLAELPDLAAHEAAALVKAQKTGVRAPHLVAHSNDGDDNGFGVPVVLKTFLSGHIMLRPADCDGWLDALAQPLALLHQHAMDKDFGWHHSSWVMRNELAVPAWTTVPELWERAIDKILLDPPPSSPDVFLHRDYHPTNVLYDETGTTSVGVLDWINACIGPAGVDVAHCRTNLVLMFGAGVADHFLASYERHVARLGGRFEYNAYWDWDSVMEMCLPTPKFYAPWEIFGLDVVAADTLRQRLDAYMQTLVFRL